MRIEGPIVGTMWEPALYDRGHVVALDDGVCAHCHTTVPLRTMAAKQIQKQWVLWCASCFGTEDTLNSIAALGGKRMALCMNCDHAFVHHAPDPQGATRACARNGCPCQNFRSGRVVGWE